jgi:putative transposase
MKLKTGPSAESSTKTPRTAALIVALSIAAIVGLTIWFLVQSQLLLVQGEVDATRVDIAALRAIYRAETAQVAELRLGDFEAEWGKKYPAIGLAWRRAWNEVTPFFAYPPQIRKMIYTTNAIESPHRGLRKIIKTRGAFPSDEAAMKLLYLALRNLGVHWKPAIEWRAAYAQFTIFFPDRLPTTIR